MERRPLLEHLPMLVEDVRISIAGLSADDSTTQLLVDPGRGTKARAREIYLRALASFGDSGEAYDVRLGSHD